MLRIPLPEYDGFALRPCSKKRGVRRGKRTLAEHGNVPVRRSVHDCATRGESPYGLNFTSQSFGRPYTSPYHHHHN